MMSASNLDLIPSSKRKRRSGRLRFTLAGLLALTSLVAVWMPTWINWRRLPTLRSQSAQIVEASGRLTVADPEQLNLRRLPINMMGVSAWRVHVPARPAMQVRLAVEDLNSLGFPAQYEAIDLPPGEHEVALRVNQTGGEHRWQVWIDDSIAATVRRPSGWFDKYSSITTSIAGADSAVKALDEPLRLHHETWQRRTPGRSQAIMSSNQVIDHCGTLFWIDLTDRVSPPPPHWVTPKISRMGQTAWGNRAGIQLMTPRSQSTVLVVRVLDQSTGTFRNQDVSVVWGYHNEDSASTTRSFVLPGWRMVQAEGVNFGIEQEAAYADSMTFDLQGVRNQRPETGPLLRVRFERGQPDVLQLEVPDVPANEGLAWLNIGLPLSHGPPGRKVDQWVGIRLADAPEGGKVDLPMRLNDPVGETIEIYRQR